MGSQRAWRFAESNNKTNTQMKKLFTLTGLFALVSTFAFAADDIVATAKATGTFKTLCAALDAAGKTEMLQGTGPFTVFAPSDEAFAKLPEGTVETLLKPENKQKLADILAYHVIAGNIKAADIRSNMVKTANGSDVDIRTSETATTINGAKVVKADVIASNGVIHVIDTVLMPPAK